MRLSSVTEEGEDEEEEEEEEDPPPLPPTRNLYVKLMLWSSFPGSTPE